jgi:hypothetical protein
MSQTGIILPGEQSQASVDAQIAHLPEVVWLRNPATGIIYKFLKKHHADNIRHALNGETGEGGRRPFTLASEADAKAQAVELAQLQGRPLPPWATEAKDAQESTPKASSK